MLPVFERPPCSLQTQHFSTLIHFCQTEAGTEEVKKHTQNLRQHWKARGRWQVNTQINLKETACRTIEDHIEITWHVQSMKWKRQSLDRGMFLFSSVFFHVFHWIRRKWGMEGVLWKLLSKFRWGNYLDITPYLNCPANPMTKSPWEATNRRNVK